MFCIREESCMKKYVIPSALLLLMITTFFIVRQYTNKIKFSYYDEGESSITLRLLSTWNMHNEKDSVFLNLISEYNSSQSLVRIENEYTPENEHFSKIESDFSSGNEPDIFISWPNEEIRQLVDREKIVILNEFLKTDNNYYSSFNKSIWKYVSQDDQIYGLPLESIFVGFYCNTDVLNAAGIKNEPQTYDDLLTDIEILKRKNIIPISTSLQPDGILIYEALAASLGMTSSEDPIYSEENGVCQSYKTAAEYVKELYEKGAFPSNFLTISDYESKSIFLNKQAAFTLQYSDFLSNATNINKETVQSISLNIFPVFKQDYDSRRPLLYGVGPSTLYVSSKTWKDPEKRNAISNFLRFITSGTSMVNITRQRGTFPSVKVPHVEIYSDNYAYQQNYQLYKTINEVTAFPNNYVSHEKQLQIYNNFPYYLNNLLSIECCDIL